LRSFGGPAYQTGKSIFRDRWLIESSRTARSSVHMIARSHPTTAQRFIKIAATSNARGSKRAI
jgi:hypothetical protein